MPGWPRVSAPSCTSGLPAGCRNEARTSSSRSAPSISAAPRRCTPSSTAALRPRWRPMAAEALQLAGKRALSREALTSARKLLLQALELEPTLERRYLAAKAASRIGDLPAVSVEMEQTLREAEAAGDRRARGKGADGAGPEHSAPGRRSPTCPRARPACGRCRRRRRGHRLVRGARPAQHDRLVGGRSDGRRTSRRREARDRGADGANRSPELRPGGARRDPQRPAGR